MINSSARFVKRFAVLIPGIVIAIISVRNIFPLIDKRAPLGFAVFFTYVLGAYVLVPALIRVIRIVLPARHLPVYSVTPDGFASDPVNVGVIGSKQELIAAMQAAGWYVADDHAPHNVLRELICIIFKLPYPTAPMSNLYLFGRKQDIGFEIPIEGLRGHRHHVRFWATTYDKNVKLSSKAIHWHKRTFKLNGKQLLWLGAASRDVGFAIIRHNAQLTHMIHADTNAERELIVNGLRAAGKADETETISLGLPYRLVNRAWRGQLHSDGKLCVVRLQQPTER